MTLLQTLYLAILVSGYRKIQDPENKIVRKSFPGRRFFSRTLPFCPTRDQNKRKQSPFALRRWGSASCTAIYLGKRWHFVWNSWHSNAGYQDLCAYMLPYMFTVHRSRAEEAASAWPCLINFVNFFFCSFDKVNLIENILEQMESSVNFKYSFKYSIGRLVDRILLRFLTVKSDFFIMFLTK